MKTFVLSIHLPVVAALICSLLVGCGPSPNPQGSDAETQKVKDSNLPKAGQDVSVGNWGPTETRVGASFNAQPNGVSAMWVTVTGLKLSPNNYVLFDNHKITDLMQKPTHITFGVPDEAFATEGNKKVSIFEAETGRKIDVGIFKVLPAN